MTQNEESAVIMMQDCADVMEAHSIHADANLPLWAAKARYAAALITGDAEEQKLQQDVIAAYEKDEQEHWTKRVLTALPEKNLPRA